MTGAFLLRNLQINFLPNKFLLERKKICHLNEANFFKCFTVHYVRNFFLFRKREIRKALLYRTLAEPLNAIKRSCKVILLHYRTPWPSWLPPAMPPSARTCETRWPSSPATGRSCSSTWRSTCTLGTSPGKSMAGPSF